MIIDQSMKETIYSLSVWEDIVTWFHWDWWSDVLCILLHWLAWIPHSSLLRWCSVELAKYEIDSLRINFYNSWSRSLDSRWFYSQVKEIEDVILDMEKSYEKIFLLWHSVWWLLSFLVDKNHIDGIVWVDPSIVWISNFLQRVEKFDDRYIKKWSIPTILSSVYVDEITQQSDDYMKKISIPYLCFFSQECEYYYDHRKKTANMRQDQKITLIEWTSHSFQEYGKQEEVFKRSIEWLVSKL